MTSAAPSLHFDPLSGQLSGGPISESQRVLGDLKGLFANEGARAAMDQARLAYKVQCHFPVADGTPGGLFFGVTHLEPGLVGDEYMMTKGHFHAAADRGEYYWGIQGQGALILMDAERRTRVEWVRPGSLHYIPGHTAHRMANTGDSLFSFGACWPSDAGHDYASIAKAGFSARLLKRREGPTLVQGS